MAANPVGLLVTAIGTLLAVLGSFAVSAALTAESTDTLASSINEARQAYEDTRAELQESQASTLSMVDALARLAEEEHKTSAEKAAMLELVEQLNEAVPSLSLAYDAQTDSLNLTAEAHPQPGGGGVCPAGAGGRGGAAERSLPGADQYCQ